MHDTELMWEREYQFAFHLSKIQSKVFAPSAFIGLHALQLPSLKKTQLLNTVTDHAR